MQIWVSLLSLHLDNSRSPGDVPVVCPMARSETVCRGHSRTMQLASELQILLWLVGCDKPVPRRIVCRAA
jgi:hypothetical protein